MTLWRRSRFVWDASDYTTALPPRAWSRRAPTVGGVRISATGLPASYVVRRDHVLGLTLRFYEWEWSDVHALVAWGQASETIDWYPDADELTMYEVYLQSPAMGEDIAPQRMQEFPRVLELPIEVRKVDGTIWTDEYWPDSEAS